MGERRSNLLEVTISHEGLRLALVYRDEVLESSRKGKRQSNYRLFSKRDLWL